MVGGVFPNLRADEILGRSPLDLWSSSGISLTDNRMNVGAPFLHLLVLHVSHLPPPLPSPPPSLPLSQTHSRGREGLW